jgi:hypothetical protein
LVDSRKIENKLEKLFELKDITAEEMKKGKISDPAGLP